MKIKSFDKPLYLNLYNFNTPAAQDCPYVLTSPRSLEACRKAGYKPVELLYKSLQEYQDDLGADTSTQVYQLYADQEQERLSKLEKCRAIRLELMTQLGSLKENAPPLPSTGDQKSLKTSVTSTRKERLDKENTSRLTGKEATALKVLGYNHNTHPKCEDGDTLYLINEATSTSHSTSKRQSTYTSESNSHRLKDIRSSKKIAGKCKSFSTAPHLQLDHGSSPSAISSISSTSASIKLNKRKTRPTRTHFDKQCTKTSIKHLPNIDSSPSSASSHGANKRKIKCQNLNRKQNAHDYRHTNNLDSSNTSRSSSTDSSATPLRRKHVSFSYMSTEDLHLSEHDRRILELMALKKEIERENNEFAYQVHQLWEQDRDEREQQNNMEMTQWKELVAEKRRLENIENSRKMEEMKHSLRRSQQQLESRIRLKDEHAMKLRHALERRRMSAVVERNQSAAKRRAEAEAAHHQRETEAALWQKMLDEQQKLRLERAETTRIHHQETYRRRVASANRVEELRHQERWQQIQEETEAALQELRKLCQQREEHAQEKYKQMQQDRNKQLKGQSLERAIRFQQAHQLHDELDLGLKKWQDQILALQWNATQQAAAKATRHLDSKRQRVETENRARWLHHTHLMDRISREDEARVHYIRQLITRKEAKMQQMAKERDLAIRESRLHAQTTADLREHIRRTLSPETFDRKVARVALEMRIAGRSTTASPPMTRSHIFLG